MNEKEESIILKRALIQYISHDVQGAFFSVASVAAMAKLACEKDEDPFVFLEHLMDACQTFKHKLSNFVEYSRRDAGLKNTRMEPVDVRRLLNRVLNESRIQADDADVRVSLYISDSLPNEVQSDELRLYIVCTNLITVAIESSLKAEGVAINIDREDDNNWSIAIETKGTNLTSEIWKNLFNSRGEDTASTNSVRLAFMVSRYIVEDILKGKMFISRQEESTRFKAILPYNVIE
jgi:light-regulated signal transduction histidine kinase (bacteriophytochrome)